MPLTFLLTQTSPNWKLTEATENKLVFKPTDSEDELAAIEFIPRTDNPLKAMALLKGKGFPLNGQDLVYQREVKPKDYLSLASQMHEIISMDLESFDL
jgi:hypothetical protein